MCSPHSFWEACLASLPLCSARGIVRNFSVDRLFGFFPAWMQSGAFVATVAKLIDARNFFDFGTYDGSTSALDPRILVPGPCSRAVYSGQRRDHAFSDSYSATRNDSEMALRMRSERCDRADLRNAMITNRLL
jgi:hypothetical protein